MIAAVALIGLVVLVLSVTKGRERLHERRRAEADDLRLEAARREAAARDEAARASEQRAQAEVMEREAEARRAAARRREEEVSRERAAGDDAARRAEELDPDAPDPGDDFRATDAPTPERTEADGEDSPGVRRA